MLGDKIKMPTPRNLLGGLAGTMDVWPDFQEEERPEYLRETTEHEDVLYYFTKILVMADEFKQKAAKKKMSKYMGVGLEAFLVLTYVNNYEAWMNEFDGKLVANPIDFDTGAAKAAPGQPKFTSLARGKGKHKGWSRTGMSLYKELCHVLENQRRNRNSNLVLSSVDDNLLARYKSGVQAGATRVEEEVVDYHEASDVSDDDED